jgi:hypothetical protein
MCLGEGAAMIQAGYRGLRAEALVFGARRPGVVAPRAPLVGCAHSNVTHLISQVHADARCPQTRPMIPECWGEQYVVCVTRPASRKRRSQSAQGPARRTCPTSREVAAMPVGARSSGSCSLWVLTCTSSPMPWPSQKSSSNAASCAIVRAELHGPLRGLTASTEPGSGRPFDRRRWRRPGGARDLAPVLVLEPCDCLLV